MLEIIAVGQVGIWLLEFIALSTIAGFIHSLLVIVVVLVLFYVVQDDQLVTVPVHDEAAVRKVNLKMTQDEVKTLKNMDG